MDWNAIKSDYIAGGTSYRKLCDKYGVSRTTLQRRAKDEGWVKLRSQAQAKTETKIVETVSNSNAKTANRIIYVADKLLDKIADIIEHIDTTAGIKDISTAIKNIKEIKGFKSDADVREQEARIRNLEKQAESEHTDNEIRVVIEDDLDNYGK